MSTVRSSTLRAPLTPRSWNARWEFFASARSTEKTTSSAVNGAPSWKRTPGRRRKRHVVASTFCHDTAREGSSANSRLRVTSDS